MARLLPEDLNGNLRACQPDQSLDTKAAGKEYVLIRDGATGEAKFEAHFPGLRRVNIQKMKKLWSQGINIKYGKRLTSISDGPDGPIAHFEDDTIESGSMIIGADGGASQVRRRLLSEEQAAQEVLSYAFMNFSVTYTREQAIYLDSVMNPNVDAATHPKNMYLGLFLLDKPDLERPETWVFYILVTWPIASKEDEENSPNRLERLRAHMDGWAEPYKSAVAWLPDDIVIKADQLRIWHPKPWDNRHGSVTLAGDAAHSMTFDRGQGGNLAIKDADELVNAMVSVQKGERSLKDAIDAYDKGALARGEEVETSKQQTDAFHDYENFMNSPVVKLGVKPAAASAQE